MRDHADSIQLQQQAVRALGWAQRWIAYCLAAVCALVWLDHATLAARQLGGGLLLDTALLLAFTALVGWTLFTWALVGIVATRSGGWLYGALHVALIVVLTPVFFVGPFTIPSLVTGDLDRWRLDDISR